MAESHRERLCVVLLDPEVDWLQAAHVEKQLGLLQSHGAAPDTGSHINDLSVAHLFMLLQSLPCSGNVNAWIKK